MHACYFLVLRAEFRQDNFALSRVNVKSNVSQGRYQTFQIMTYGAYFTTDRSIVEVPGVEDGLDVSGSVVYSEGKYGWSTRVSLLQASGGLNSRCTKE